MNLRPPRLAAAIAVGAVSLLLTVSILFLSAPAAPARGTYLPAGGVAHAVRLWRISYRAHDGHVRAAELLLPAWYGPSDDPPLPLVISPHGRGRDGSENSKLWGDLPALGRFAVISPAGQGRRLRAYSWGAPGQISDLARMPAIVRHALPWLKLKPHAVFAVGGSMGGQETLLLVARHPHLLAGAAAFDSVTDFARQYKDFPQLRCDSRCHRQWHGPLGAALQQLARREVGGTPASNPTGYSDRSPLHFAHRIAFSGVPLELWWSTADLIVRHQQRDQTGALFARIRALNPDAPVEAFVGHWIHSHEETPASRLPFALAQLGLLPLAYDHRYHKLHYQAAAQEQPPDPPAPAPQPAFG